MEPLAELPVGLHDRQAGVPDRHLGSPGQLGARVRANRAQAAGIAGEGKKAKAYSGGDFQH